MCLCTAVQAEPAGTTVNLSVPQVQLINPENQIVEASSNLWELPAETTLPRGLVSGPYFLFLLISNSIVFPSPSAGWDSELGQWWGWRAFPWSIGPLFVNEEAHSGCGWPTVSIWPTALINIRARNCHLTLCSYYGEFVLLHCISQMRSNPVANTCFYPSSEALVDQTWFD